MIDNQKILNEMMIHIVLNTQKEPKKVLVVGEVDDHFIQEINKYNIEVVYSQRLNIDGVFDSIIYMEKFEYDQLPLIHRLLDQKIGIFVCLSEMFQKNKDKLIYDLEYIGKNFWICMPYKFGHFTAILASHKYHPQADIILDRSDFIDGEYYNSEIHNCSFVMPNYIFKALRNIAKR
jgi:spermidine synthase